MKIISFDELIVNPKFLPQEDLDIVPQEMRHGLLLNDESEMDIVWGNICAQMLNDLL